MSAAQPLLGVEAPTPAAVDEPITVHTPGVTRTRMTEGGGAGVQDDGAGAGAGAGAAAGTAAGNEGDDQWKQPRHSLASGLQKTVRVLHAGTPPRSVDDDDALTLPWQAPFPPSASRAGTPAAVQGCGTDCRNQSK